MDSTLPFRRPVRVAAGIPRPVRLIAAAIGVLGLALVARQQGIFPVTSPVRTLAMPGSAEALAHARAGAAAIPDDPDAQARLGLATLDRVRETSDLMLYPEAAAAFDRALARDPEHFEAVLGSGMLALARHRFVDSLEWGLRAEALNPYSAAVQGVLVDARVELGRYDEALTTSERMVALRPGQAAYGRIAYLRELHGDVDGAAEAMLLASQSGAPSAEGTLWSRYQLGMIQLHHGRLDAAAAAFEAALRARPDYALARGGQALVAAAQGDHQAAIEMLEPLVADAFQVDFATTLGELYQASGRHAEATALYQAARENLVLDIEAGTDMDLPLALLEVDRGLAPATAERVALARKGYAAAPSVVAADSLAWVLFHAGELAEASAFSAEARRLGTRDARFEYHAGAIAAALGDDAAAIAHLRAALAINPAFSVRDAPAAAELLAELLAER